MPATHLPPLVLRNGVTIEDVLKRTREFVESDASYRKYDLAPVAQDSTLTREDIRVANWLIARMSPRVIDSILERRSAIGAALSLIPPTATLTAADEEIPWPALAELMAAFEGVPEVGLARCTRSSESRSSGALSSLPSPSRELTAVEGLREDPT